jgi:hyperosmotically inducible periplasmic protein
MFSAAPGCGLFFELTKRSVEMKRFVYLLFSAFLMAGIAACESTRTKQSAGEYADDAQITARVKTALLQAPGVKSTAVNVETFRGVVQLSGFVDSREMASNAIAAAQKVPGVKSVKDDMRIKQAGS